MKPALQIKIGQNLKLTPQLQHAISLLHMSAQELETEIQNILESNTALEIKEEENNQNQQEEYSEKELAIDTNWEDIYPDYNIGTRNKESENINFDNFTAKEINLHEHLLWQLNLTPFSKREKIIATTIIDAINDSGYLSISLSELKDTLINYFSDLTIEEINSIRKYILQFDPIAVGAVDLQECLLIQLESKKSEVLLYELTQNIIKNNLSLLASKNYSKLKRLFNLTEKDLKQITKNIILLKPRPAATFVTETNNYITPDVIVKNNNGSWLIELNKKHTQKIILNPNYESMLEKIIQKTDKNFMQTQVNEAKWFLKSLKNRNETLLKVSNCIMQKQKKFLIDGETAMEPLVLQDIATETGLHESTISRITNKKYIDTPQGIYELKSFFSSHLANNSGDKSSSTSVKAKIKHIIETESKSAPLSDSKIAKLLEKEGIVIARRTVAKYREAMLILPSSERKQLI